MSELTVKDVEKNIPEGDKRLSMYLMGCAYDILRRNKGIKNEQLSLLLASQVQKNDPTQFGLYKYRQDEHAQGFKVERVDWSQALSQYSREKVSQWEEDASKKGVALQDYLLDNISGNLVTGYHPSGYKIVDASLDRMLSEECSNAACKNFDEKEREVKGDNNYVLLDAVNKALRGH